MSRIRSVLAMGMDLLPWLVVGMVLFGAASAAGQPLGPPAPTTMPTDPVESREVEQLRHITRRFADLEHENRDLYQRVAILESTAAGQPIIEWTPETVMEEGGTYRLPEGSPANIRVDVRDVTLLGGRIWPTDQRAAIRVGAPGCTIQDVEICTGRTEPTGKLKIGPGIELLSEGTIIRRVGLGHVDTGVLVRKEATNTVIDRLSATNGLRAGLIYVDGASHGVIQRCSSSGSRTENLVRFSPGDGSHPKHWTIRDNDLTNTHKGVVDIRCGEFIDVVHNRLRGDHRGSVISFGSSSRPEMFTRHVRAVGNETWAGRIHLRGGVRHALIQGNTGRALEGRNRQGELDDIFIQVSGGERSDVQTFDVTIENNTAHMPEGATNPAVRLNDVRSEHQVVEAGNVVVYGE